MFAIDKLRAISHDADTRMSVLEPDLWLHKCAILELAERLRLLEGDVRELAEQVRIGMRWTSACVDAAGKVEPAKPFHKGPPFQVHEAGIYRMRNGLEAEVISVTKFSVRGYIKPLKAAKEWDHNGKKGLYGDTHPYDLVAYLGPLTAEQPEQKRITGWMNIWRLSNGDIRTGQVIWSDRDEADVDHAPDWKRMACIFIDCEEGEGDGK